VRPGSLRTVFALLVISGIAYVVAAVAAYRFLFSP
jgi:hypothetical protein